MTTPPWHQQQFDATAFRCHNASSLQKLWTDQRQARQMLFQFPAAAGGGRQQPFYGDGGVLPQQVRPVIFKYIFS